MRYVKQTDILTHATHENSWFPAVYMSCMSQSFRLFHVSNLSVRNFRIFLLMYTGSVSTMDRRRPAGFRVLGLILNQGEEWKIQTVNQHKEWKIWSIFGTTKF